MKDYAPISCTDYDWLELVCTYRYEIELTLDDRTVVGTAETLQTHPPGEYLILRLANGDTSKIRVDLIQLLIVITRPARFESHRFASASPGDDDNV